MKKTIILAIFANLLTTHVFADGDDDSGLSYDDKLQSCSACHGPDGDQPLAPDYPILAGQYADYLESSLKSYRDGRRNNPIMAMQVQMLNLTDEDIRRLSAHFASKRGLSTLAD